MRDNAWRLANASSPELTFKSSFGAPTGGVTTAEKVDAGAGGGGRGLDGGDEGLALDESYSGRSCERDADSR